MFNTQLSSRGSKNITRVIVKFDFSEMRERFRHLAGHYNMQQISSLTANQFNLGSAVNHLQGNVQQMNGNFGSVSKIYFS